MRREAFKNLLNDMVSSGRLNALSQWADFKLELEPLPEAVALVADSVSLQSVFFEVVDKLMTRYKSDKRVGMV